MKRAGEKASILLIYTGGTIGMKPDEKSGVLAPYDFSDLDREFPNLKYLNVNIELQSFEPIDSSNVTPELWVRLARIIHDRYEEFDGFVILHGTDTMSYTSSALSFMLENLAKPVVFTGSQIPIGVMRTDGRKNLITAIEIAAAKIDGRAAVPEVCLYFQDKLYRANRTTKYSAEELDAFHSDNFPPLAVVGVSIQFHHRLIHKPDTSESLTINTVTDDNVIIVRVFPGLTEANFKGMLSIPGLRGVILETYGAGNAPTKDWFLGALREAMERGVFIMNVTQCSSGSVNMDIYETGLRMQEIGVISGRDITTEAAVAKMMCLIGQDIPCEKVVEKLNMPLRGEITL